LCGDRRSSASAARRQHHDGLPIEHDVVLQAEVPDGLERRDLMRAHRRDDRFPDVQRLHTLAGEGAHQKLGGGAAEQRPLARRRPVQHRAVFRDHRAAQPRLREDREKIAQNSAGDQNEGPSGGDESLNGRNGGWTHFAIFGQRAVIIGCHRDYMHRFTISRLTY
jgi:hypothetical protein